MQHFSADYINMCFLCMNWLDFCCSFARMSSVHCCGLWKSPVGIFCFFRQTGSPHHKWCQAAHLLLRATTGWKVALDMHKATVLPYSAALVVSTEPSQGRDQEQPSGSLSWRGAGEELRALAAKAPCQYSIHKPLQLLFLRRY